MREVRHALLVALAGAALACTPRDEPLPEVPVQPPPPRAATFTADDFRGLSWIEGPWRGFLTDGSTFYERYAFLDDSTVMVRQFADSTLTQATDSSRLTLRAGTIANDAGAARWVATRLDSAGADFSPLRGATSQFTWVRESPTRWDVTMRWTDESGTPQTRVSALHRLGN